MSRWVLHRGGIVNVWQYAVEEFDLSGGRAIFQGTNGSGKSRTLELLLPLCLDGDLHQIGSKGYDTVSMRRLMLDDYTGGPNRIGYAWVEFRREVDGVEHFLTSGIGIKASASSQQIADSWRFITDRRANTDFPLVVDGAPVGATALRDELGADCLYDDVPFRARIAELIYGIPATRYADLLHLQRTLRNPDVGLKVLDGQLEQILADSLPPLDPAVIEQLAQSFEDLESIRDNIKTLVAADTALGRFLGSYAGYALGVLRSAGRRAADAGGELAKARADVAALTERRQQQQETAERVTAEVAELDQRHEALDERIDDLKSSPAYEGMRDLNDRKRAVDAARGAAESALGRLATQREHTDALVDSALAELRRLGTDTGHARALAGELGGRMREIGLDPGLLPTLPTVPDAEPDEVAYQVRDSLDPEADAVRVTRRLPPQVDPGAVATGLRAAAERAGQVRTVLRRRRAEVSALLQRSADLDGARQEVSRLRGEAHTAQLAATDATGRRDHAAQRLTDAVETWRDAVSRWCTGGPLAGTPVHDLAPPETATLTGDRDAARRASDATAAWLRARLPELLDEVGRLDRALSDVDGRIEVANEELAALQSGVDAEPALPGYRTAERDPAAGVAFYRLVDFADGLSDAERAGCEAALEASGLLNAWVGADGALHDAGRHDLHAVLAGERQAGRTLADVLVPAVPPESPVAAEVVHGLLGRVGLGGTDGALPGGLSVGVDGRWRAGVLAGAMAKETAAFVGAGARESARKRRIAELTDLLGVLADERDTLVGALAEARDRVGAWELHLAEYPDAQQVLAAHITLDTARETAEQARRHAVDKRAEHTAAADRCTARENELTADARAAGLTAGTDALRQAETVAGQAAGTADALTDVLDSRCPAGVTALGEVLARHDRAAADLTTVAATADRACAEYGTEAQSYAERVESIGGEVARLRDQLSTMEDERKVVRKRLPEARKEETGANVAVEKTKTKLEDKQAGIGALADREQAARRQFTAVLGAEGVYSAALGEPADVPDDPADALAALDGVRRDTVTEDAVQGDLQALHTALTGSHDITVHRVADALTVTVTGPAGPQPVAVAARDVADRLAEQQNLLSEEYQQIFNTHLLRDLADKLAAQIGVADDLCRRMNDTLDVARSSQGVHVQLDWQHAPELDEEMREALRLIRTPFAKRDSDGDERLRLALTERITAERDGYASDYAEVLGRALDYRSWYRFTVRVRDAGPDGEPRIRRMRQLSSGETRLISYVTLFAAASAFYDAVSTGADHPPARLVLLDEAFERLDDPTIARMLGLLVDLDMDWIITWPSGWGLSEKIPRMHIYDVLRPKGGTGIACTHAIWTGTGLSADPDRG